jgi:hypothetical protein
MQPHNLFFLARQFMTAGLILCGFAVAGVAGLIVTSEGLAETRLMPDPNGVVLQAAPADASTVAAVPIPNTAKGAANVASSVSIGEPALSESANEPLAPANAPATSWLSRARQFVAGIVLESGN